MPERSPFEPMTISVSLTPCVACAAEAMPAANAAARMDFVIAFLISFLLVVAFVPYGAALCLTVHLVDQTLVLLFHEAALQLHGRRQFIIFGRQQHVDQAKILDLLDP